MAYHQDQSTAQNSSHPSKGLAHASALFTNQTHMTNTAPPKTRMREYFFTFDMFAFHNIYHRVSIHSHPADVDTGKIALLLTHRQWN